MVEVVLDAGAADIHLWVSVAFTQQNPTLPLCCLVSFFRFVTSRLRCTAWKLRLEQQAETTSTEPGPPTEMSAFRMRLERHPCLSARKSVVELLYADAVA